MGAFPEVSARGQYVDLTARRTEENQWFNGNWRLGQLGDDSANLSRFCARMTLRQLLSVHVGVDRKPLADVRSLEAIKLAVVLHDGAARTQAVRHHVRQHVAVQTTMLSDTPTYHRSHLNAQQQQPSALHISNGAFMRKADPSPV